MIQEHKIQNKVYLVSGIIGAITIFVLMFSFWGIEWYQDNDLEWEYGIFSVIFLIIHSIPFIVCVIGGGGAGFIIGLLIPMYIVGIVEKLHEEPINSSGEKMHLSKPRKILRIVTIIIVAILVPVGILLALTLFYQLATFLFVAAVLIIAWLCPKRWWW